MKNIALAIALISFLFIQLFQSTKLNAKLESTTYLNKALVGSSLTQGDVSKIWQQLFMVPRTTACRAAMMRQKLMGIIQAEFGDDSENPFKGKFWWIKRWGYGPAAYLIDFLDPVFQIEAITQMNSIYNKALNYSQADTNEYKDPFDMKKLINADSKRYASKVNFKSLNKNYDPAIHGISINTVQIRQLMKDWNWFMDIAIGDYAKDFVLGYDINGDGRLNAREFILAAIVHNKNAIGSGLCKNCFEFMSKKLDALFIFLDCNNNGFLTAEELFGNLPKLNRHDGRWDIFAFDNNENIRTNSINDFIIKNGIAREGSLTKDEWRSGVLLAYWDRHTRETGIVDDDSRTLKELRWDDNDTVDTVAFNYVKEKMIEEMLMKGGK